MMGVDELAEQLQLQTTSNRVGVFLGMSVSQEELDRLDLKLNFASVDIVERVLSRVPVSSTFIGLDANQFLMLVDAISEGVYDRTTVLLRNFDVVLARFTDSDRTAIWTFLRENLRKRRTSLAIALPESAEHLFLNSERQRWQGAHMLARLTF